MNSPVHVVGTGVISAIGDSCSACYASLQKSNHGIRPLTSLDSIYKGSLPVGQVHLTDEELAQKVGLEKPVTRTALLGLYAIKEAWREAGIKSSRWRRGLISGTTVGGMDRTEVFFPSFLTNPASGHLADVVHHSCGATTEIMAQALGITEFITTINTACSSSVNAIIYGVRLIRHNKLDIVIAGGTDALTRFTINGFKSLMILDDDLCCPFDEHRKGLNLGEGAGFVILASERVVREEGLQTKAIVSGFGNTNDAFHQTASSPDGRGSYDAMAQALAMANLTPEEIGYINLHGTGTMNNDLSEGTAIRRLFGTRLPPLSSSKSFTGHTLGASGGIESVFSIMALQHQCVFPNLRFQSPIKELDIVPQQEFEMRPVRHVLNNAFGFGGNCSSIAFSIPASS